MSPWARVLAAFVAVVVAAMLLKVLPPIVVLAMLVGGLAYVNHRWKPVSPKKQVAETSAQVLGLEHAPVDRFGLAGYPFALLQRSAEPEIANIVWGAFRGKDVKAFELRLDLATADGSSARRRFACATAPSPAMAPPLVLEPVAFLFAPAERAPAPELSIGDAAFDERFSVRCADETFAREVLSPEMCTWLMSSGEGWGFELAAGVALAYQPVDAWSGATESIEALAGFVERIPAFVSKRYPLPPPEPAQGAPSRAVPSPEVSSQELPSQEAGGLPPVPTRPDLP